MNLKYDLEREKTIGEQEIVRENKKSTAFHLLMIIEVKKK